MRYIKLFLSLASISSKQYLEHRWNTLGIIFLTALSVFLTVIFAEVYFSFTKELYGWTKYQVFFLSGIFNMMSALFSFLFLRSINLLQFVVRNGELDFMLTKPVYSQFLVSFRFMRSYAILNVIPGLVLTSYALSKLEISVSLFSIILLVLNLVLGLLVLYGLYFTLATLVFWLSSTNAIPSIYNVAEQFISLPIDIYGKWVSFLLSFVIPLAFVVTVPVKIFFNTSLEYLTIVQILLCIFVLSFSTAFWNYALRYYTSASS